MSWYRDKSGLHGVFVRSCSSRYSQRTYWSVGAGRLVGYVSMYTRTYPYTSFGAGLSYLNGLVSDDENSRPPGIVGYFTQHVAPAAVWDA